MMMMRRLALPVRLPCLNMSRGLVRQVKHPLPPSHILRLLVSPVALPRSKARVFIKRTARVRTNSPTVLPRTVFFASDAFLLLQDPSTVAAFSLVGRFLALYQSARARYGIEFLEAGFPLVRPNPIKARSFARRQLRLEAARGSMGAGVSDIAGVEACKVSRAGLGELPELCAAEVLLYLDAPDICRLALLNRTFRGAAAADFVWEAKLPGNYGYLLGFVHGAEEEEEGGGMRSAMGKKEVYARLAKPVPFDDGKKEFWLEKSKGRVCMALSSKALVITGIDDRRYWVHMPTTESRFHSVAYLQQIWWFEVVGKIDFCFPAGTYSLYFRLHLGKTSKRFGRRVCSSEHIHGWDKKPVRFQLSTSDGQHALSQCYLDEPGSWLLYHVGDFVASKPEQPIKLKFSLAQIDCTHTKGGLCVDSVLIYPKGFQQEKVIRAQK